MKLMYFETSDPRLVCKEKKQFSVCDETFGTKTYKCRSLILIILLVLFVLRGGAVPGRDGFMVNTLDLNRVVRQYESPGQGYFHSVSFHPSVYK